MIGTGDSFMLVARAAGPGTPAYIGGINIENGNLFIGFVPGGGGYDQFDLAPTDLRVADEDVMLQFDVVGNSLSLWGWRPGQSMPDQPQATAEDNLLTMGTPGLALEITSGISGSAVFRFVHVADTHILEYRPGDFDLDYDVDGDDFLAWQTGFGLSSGASPHDGDAEWDGDVDGDDFVIWQVSFDSGAAAGQASAAPTPRGSSPHPVDSSTPRKKAVDETFAELDRVSARWTNRSVRGELVDELTLFK